MLRSGLRGPHPPRRPLRWWLIALVVAPMLDGSTRRRCPVCLLDPLYLHRGHQPKCLRREPARPALARPRSGGGVDQTACRPSERGAPEPQGPEEPSARRGERRPPAASTAVCCCCVAIGKGLWSPPMPLPLLLLLVVLSSPGGVVYDSLRATVLYVLYVRNPIPCGGGESSSLASENTPNDDAATSGDCGPMSIHGTRSPQRPPGSAPRPGARDRTNK